VGVSTGPHHFEPGSRRNFHTVGLSPCGYVGPVLSHVMVTDRPITDQHTTGFQHFGELGHQPFHIRVVVVDQHSTAHNGVS
jgi:hypothetical protein